jgi:hypothetical protein
MNPLQFGWEKRRITPSCLLSRSNVISLFSTEYAQCNVCRRVISLFVQQGNLWCVWFMIRARRLNLEETAISSTCVRLIARPVVQHTCSITPKIIKMSGLLSNATFIDKAVYHSGCITKYLLTRTPGISYESFAVWLGKKTDHSFLSTFKVKCHLTFYKILFALVKEKQSVPYI